MPSRNSAAFLDAPGTPVTEFPGIWKAVQAIQQAATPEAPTAAATETAYLAMKALTRILPPSDHVFIGVLQPGAKVSKRNRHHHWMATTIHDAGLYIGGSLGPVTHAVRNVPPEEVLKWRFGVADLHATRFSPSQPHQTTSSYHRWYIPVGQLGELRCLPRSQIVLYARLLHRICQPTQPQT